MLNIVYVYANTFILKKKGEDYLFIYLQVEQPSVAQSQPRRNQACAWPQCNENKINKIYNENKKRPCESWTNQFTKKYWALAQLKSQMREMKNPTRGNESTCRNNEIPQVI